MTMMISIENGQQISIIVTSFISILLSIVSVGLRLVARSIGHKIDYSDYCIIAALFCNTALHACCISLVTHGGFGFHIAEIYQRFGPETATLFFKGIMSFSILWNATVCFSKLSVLLMYPTLIPTLSMLKRTRVLGALIITWNMADFIAVLLICRPLAKNWDLGLPGTCGNQPAFYFAMGFVNLLMDAVIIVLPMPYLYNLRLAWHEKLAAMALLSVGAGTWAITIYRQTLLPSLDFTDMTYSGVLATNLSGLEPAVAIALACIPHMRPLFRKSRRTTHSSYQCGSSRQISLFPKKRSELHSIDPTAPFPRLVDNNDASSQAELQPINPSHMVRVSSVYKH
ncbi:hypothetical protein J3E72DRAFT_238604 [Bipolaris maydis]|nr:hypothetical protein J3E73DRAFT_408081 [Bipolaris maydis]KAJ6200000.1 hypothetical protein J3E72DRAFT_238604 [Bipolaris maydis]KAJ6273127.1 hypothetical protein PSV08DRAFT_387776 [Bipolaris maydis]KAJ6284223.1 hypothetical protein J3E71DRAFT_377797 [Bipolaris maydis]